MRPEPSAAAVTSGPATWTMSLAPEGYDRSTLTDGEREAMALTMDLRKNGWQGEEAKRAALVLERLARPLTDVARLHTSCVGYAGTHAERRVQLVIYREMLKADAAFWEWPPERWLKLVGADADSFAPGQPGNNKRARAAVRTTAYLFGGVSDLRAVGMAGEATPTADIVFGRENVRREVQRVQQALAGDGYSGGPAATTHLRGTLALLFLLNRSPHLGSLSTHHLQQLLDGADTLRMRGQLRSQAHKVARALWVMGVLSESEYRPFARLHGVKPEADTSGVAAEWMAWCSVWRERATGLVATTRDAHYRNLMAVGRWLSSSHPSVTSPEQWEEELARTYVTYICEEARVGDGATAAIRPRLATRGVLGKPLAPSAIDHKLQTMRRAFADWQDREHAVAGGPPRRIPVRFKPGRAFQTPPSVQRLIQPDPRDIEQPLWWKLMRAAATLEEFDLGHRPTYPLAFVSAVALLWVTSARRPNEIGRLRVGCIRRDWDPEMLDEDGLPVEADAQFTYLHVPSGKNRGPFWVPIPAYTADAVEAWEAERPSGQPPLFDRKDRAYVEMLFCYRGKRLGAAWINQRLIPLLCRKAGVPEEDARGTITAHRGRSTTSTLLRQAGVLLDDISTFLGHNHPDTVRNYARVDPFRHARAMRKADDLSRVVEGLLDPHAAERGEPSIFFYLGYGPEGRPRFCGNPAWEQCTHRLACQQCSMYVDAEQAEELEHRDSVIRFEAKVPMLPEEKALAEGNDARMCEIVESKRDMPVPKPPSPEFVFNPKGTRAPTAEEQPRANLEQLRTELARQLAEVKQKKDGRNAVVRSLERQIVSLSERLKALDRDRPPDSSPGNPT